MNWLQTYLAAVLPHPARGAEQPENSSAPLPSRVFVFENLPIHHMKTVDSRRLVGGHTIDGCSFSAHESSLHPGCEPHPPHRHPGEEMFMVLDGTLRVTINGVSSLITKGSVAFVGSEDEHGIFNPGTVPAKYYVVEFGPQEEGHQGAAQPTAHATTGISEPARH